MMYRSSRQKCSVEKGVLKNFANFVGTYLCWNLFLKKLQVWRPATLLKRGSNTVVSCEICEIFKGTYFEGHIRTTASGCTKLISTLIKIGRYLRRIKLLETLQKGVTENGQELYWLF